jgi:16S rRNA (cytosine967-C5)-methyltransferase
MAKDMNIRALALDTLTDIDRGTKNASEAIQTTLRNYQYLDKKDRSFYTRICQGTLEYRIQLDYMINQVSRTPMNKCKPYIRNLLRMSLYQILHMDRVANEAVCNEAVKLAKQKGFQNLSGFVNGVLRNLIRQQDTLQLPEKPVRNDSDTVSPTERENFKKKLKTYYSITYSIPEWLVECFLTWYSEHTVEKMLQAFLTETPLTVRVNLCKTTIEVVRHELEEAGIHVERGHYCRNTLQISEYNYLRRIPAFREGRITVQDESSCLQGYIVPVEECCHRMETDSKEAAPKLCILDICAAPGGKTMYAAERLQCMEDRTEKKGIGHILARDISESKIARIEENIERMEYKNIELQVWDALHLDETMLGKVDILIADVPCSGLGVIGRKHDIKYRIQPEQLPELVKLQRQIVTTAVSYLKPGGYLIYSTCTVNPAENEEQVMWMKHELKLESVSIRAELPEELICEVEEQPGTNLEEGYCTLLPGLQSCDGFFFAKLRRI